MDSPIGKYFKFVGETDTHFIKGKFYECVGPLHLLGAFLDEYGNKNGFFNKNHLHFDLNNPRNTKEGRKKMFHEYEQDN